jgi:ribonuclease P protein component
VESGGLTIRYLDVARLPVEAVPKRVKEDEFRQQLKCAFSVGLKVSKKAVERNRLRRRLREIVRLLIQRGEIRSGAYVLFVGHRSLLTLKSHDVEQLVRAVLVQSRLISS